jgi:predicted kinase
MIDGGQYSKGNEKFVLAMRNNLIWEALLSGKNVIVDDTNIHPKHEEDVRELVLKYNVRWGQGVQVEVKVFNTSVEDCIARDLKREASVGADVILKMARQWSPDGKDYQAPVPELDMEALNENGLPWCVIYDLDGTAAIMGDRSPYDGSRCDKVDRCNYPLQILLQMVEEGGAHDRLAVWPALTHFIALSGRSSEYREQTERFIDKHNFPCSALYMRKEGDNRKDAVIKGELYEEHIKGKYNVLVVFDDRNQMVDFWRKEVGVPCFQVNYGDF